MQFIPLAMSARGAVLASIASIASIALIASSISACTSSQGAPDSKLALTVHLRAGEDGAPPATARVIVGAGTDVFRVDCPNDEKDGPLVCAKDGIGLASALQIGRAHV